MSLLRFLFALGAAIAAWMALMWFALLAVSTTPQGQHDRVREPVVAPAPAAEAEPAPSAIYDSPVGVRVDAAVHRTTAGAAAPELAELEQRYLACSREAMSRVLGFGEAAQCSVIYERLLSERFGGDFDRLLQWSRSMPVGP